jgi:hypothetical protein
MVRTTAVRIARRCWLPEQLADDFHARCAIAVATCADDTILSSTAAARLHGLWLPGGLEDVHLASAQPGRASRHMTRSQRPEFVAHRRTLTESDRSVLDGLPIMSLARTWLDIASVLPLADVVAAGDSALRMGCSIDELSDVLKRSVRVRGLQRARAALPLLDKRSRSRPESHLRVAATAPDLPKFAVNEPVYRNKGGWLAEPDLSLEEARIALEYQGADHAAVERMRKDITRNADMRSEGWLCLLYGPAEVFGRPWQIAPELRRLVGERAPQLLKRPRRANRVAYPGLSG